MDQIIKNKKNLIIMAGIVAIVIILAIILVCFAFKKNKGMTTETLENKLEKVGIDFYENHYYPSLGETLDETQRKELLASFKDNGIKIDITNLEVLVSVDQEVKDQLEKDQCNLDQTKVVIYPKDPYGQKDYTLEIERACEK